MAGEPILIVDDTPVNLKLTRILLVNEGYKVLTASSAEEALELLRSFHPRLILADIQLPGMDGLEFTRKVKQNETTRDIVVVALTAFAMKGDELRAAEAGCDGYITKPIDTRSLGLRLREFLDREARPSDQVVPLESSVPVAEVQALRRRFLEEGQTLTRQWLLDLDSDFSSSDAERKAHQWIGAAGLLGYSAISRLSRELEGILRDRPLDAGQLRDALTNLLLAFSTPREARDAPVPDSIVQTLAGKHVGLVEVQSRERERLCVALDRAKAIAVYLKAADIPSGEALQSCDVLVIDVRPPDRGSVWLAGFGQLAARMPFVYVGDRDDILELEPAAQRLAREYLMDAWEPDEALVRLSLAMVQPAPAAPSESRGPVALPGRARVLIADDDPTVLALVKAALENFGMECYTVENGRSALETLRRRRLDAAVLDVNMPELDGYAVLSAIRADSLPVRVLLLTARQQENDVIRGFTLGADDYVVKPFSPMELVARLKRLLWEMTGLELSVLAAVLGLYGLFIVLLLIVAWIRGARWQRRRVRTAVEVPRIRAALINYLAGNNDVTVFRDTVARNRRDFESALETLHPTVGGGGLERLCALVLELGLVHEWCQEAQSRDLRLRRVAFSKLAFACFFEPCRRLAGELVFRALDDPDRDVSMLAARAAIHSADQSEIEEVFDHAIRQSLLERILLNDGLRRHAVALCERAVPEALAFGNRDAVLATLRTLVAWERAIPLEHLEQLLQSEDREIRLEAIHLAPFVPVTAGNRTAIVAALSDPDPEISSAAAISATRLRFHEAIPQLAGLLATAPAEVARLAASGLAEMPPQGWRTLEEISANANPLAATAARAALAAARGRAIE